MGEDQDRKALSLSSDKSTDKLMRGEELHEKKSEKLGRPTIGDEPMSKRFSLLFTENEYNSIKEKAGKVPLATFIRDALKVSKVI